MKKKIICLFMGVVFMASVSSCAEVVSAIVIGVLFSPDREDSLYARCKKEEIRKKYKTLKDCADGEFRWI